MNPEELAPLPKVESALRPSAVLGGLLVYGLSLGILYFDAAAPKAPGQPGWRLEARLAWLLAEWQASDNAYRRFAEFWPSAAADRTVEARIDDADWRAARTTPSLESYSNYLRRHPSGQHVSQAAAFTEAADWRDAEHLDAIDGYQTYLGRHGAGTHAGQARKALAEHISEAEGNRVSVGGDRREIVEFLTANPNSKFRSAALRRLEEIDWGATSDSDARALETFVANHAGSARLDLAKRLLSRATERLKRELLDAVRSGSPAISRDILSRGPKDLVNVKTANLSTPLMLAADARNSELVRLLIEAGADLNVQNASNNTALIYASLRGDDTTVGLLIAAGAQVGPRNSEGRTALHYAAMQKDPNVVRALIAAKAEIDAPSKVRRTPLIEAVAQGSLDNVKLLVDAGGSLQARDSSGQTALDIAIQTGNREIAAYLRSPHAPAGLAMPDAQ